MVVSVHSCRAGKNQNFEKISQTLNGRLPPEDSSDWPQTWPKRVSDDPRHFIFWRPQKNLDEIFGAKSHHANEGSNQERAVLEELWIFERYWQLRLEKWPPMNLISALYNFWRRGKKAGFRFFLDFLAKTDLQLGGPTKTWWWCDVMMLWWYDHMMIQWYDSTVSWWYDEMLWWY